jgi:hypothetical protein
VTANNNLKRYYTAVPKGLFSTELDAIATSFLKNPQQPDPGNMLRRNYAWGLLGAGEALLIAPRVTFKVYGENVVLACLVRFFGPSATERLLDEGIVDFILWRGQIMAMVSDDLVHQGVQPIVSANLSTAVHSDPEASAKAGLGWAQDLRLDRRQLRSLARKATKRTHVTPEVVAAEAVSATMDAFQHGAFGDDTSNAAMAQQKTGLLSTATHLHEAAVLAERELDLHEGSPTWDAMLRLASEVRSSSNVPLVAEAILREERLPSIRNLLLHNVLTPADIIRLRKRPEIAEFQEWLWTRPDPANAEDILASYRRLVLKDTSGSENRFFEEARLWGLSAAGAWLGDVAAQAAGAGPLSHLLGAATGVAVNTAVGGALGQGDRLLDRILKRNPRRFASTIRDTMMLSTAHPGPS